MKKMYDVSLLVVAIVVAIAATAGYFSHKFLGEDNPVEENMEEVIEDMTGIDVDLTPEEETGGFLDPSDSNNPTKAS